MRHRSAKVTHTAIMIVNSESDVAIAGNWGERWGWVGVGVEKSVGRTKETGCRWELVKVTVGESFGRRKENRERDVKSFGGQRHTRPFELANPTPRPFTIVVHIFSQLPNRRA